jgi:hypothetical protein
MKTKSILAPAFLVLCLGVAGLLVVIRGKTNKPAMQGFTLFIEQIAYPSSGAPILSATKVRRQKSDGSWKLETTYNSNGRVEVSHGEPGRGVFVVDDKNQRLEYLSESHSQPLAGIDWTKQPGFAGEETILGFKTFLIHREDGNGNYTDSYMCPDLQGYPLRLVTGNSRYKNIWETKQVILGEPSFEPPPVLPVSTERFDAKMKDLPR